MMKRGVIMQGGKNPEKVLSSFLHLKQTKQSQKLFAPRQYSSPPRLRVTLTRTT